MNAIIPGFRKAVGYIILGAVAMYIIGALWLMIFPRTKVFSNRITHALRWLTLPGPFFQEDRIRNAGHFYVSYKKEGDDAWTDFENPELDQFDQYHDSFFDYNSLQQSRVTHYMARRIYSIWQRDSADLNRLKGWRRMDAHLRRAGYIPAEADSVRMLYFTEKEDGDVTHHETLFQFTYKSR